MRLPTVTVVRGGRPVRINESDYDPETHTLFGTESSSEDATQATYSVGDHTAAGYYILLKGGEPVIGEDGEPRTVGRGREAAQTQVDAMNEAN